jgi:hypothetical protein
MEQLLHDCWTRETEARPTFASIVERLVGDYPAAWSQGKESKSAEQEAADILALMSKDDGSPTSAIEDDEFVDASDDIDVSVISAFAPSRIGPDSHPDARPRRHRVQDSRFRGRFRGGIQLARFLRRSLRREFPS